MKVESAERPDAVLECGLESWGLADQQTCGSAAVSRFVGRSGVGEWHFTVALGEADGNPAAALESAWRSALQDAGIDPASTVMRRVFCSDVVNQGPALEAFGRAYPGAFSVIGEAPLDGSKLALWSYHISDPDGPLEAAEDDGWFCLQRGGLRHCWAGAITAADECGAARQCLGVLEHSADWLAGHGMRLADHLVRTWWFLRDIDREYADLVDVRRDFFREHGLTEQTHYIASTGIAGVPARSGALLAMDAYAIGGLVDGQVEYLSAPDHLGSTHDYGVTFERATKISYADRSQVHLSGTASIDVNGDIVHPGDVVRQLGRALENVDALLAAAGGDEADLAVMLVYLRDPADGERIGRLCRKRFPGLPLLVLQAPVCRPGWLVEVEGIAHLVSDSDTLPVF